VSGREGGAGRGEWVVRTVGGEGGEGVEEALGGLVKLGEVQMRQAEQVLRHSARLARQTQILL
jgi:hypothetical protein